MAARAEGRQILRAIAFCWVSYDQFNRQFYRIKLLN
jgi:hypothetical protein